MRRALPGAARGGPEEAFRPPHHEYTDLLPSSVPEMDPDWLDGLLERRGVDDVGEAARKQGDDP